MRSVRPRLVSEVHLPENSKQIHEWITNLCRCMNLHINVIRGGCVHGYFQQRGWEDVKHAKPLCIYANWAPFSSLNMNLAQVKLFSSSLVFCFVSLFFSHMHKKCTTACLHIIAWLHPETCESVDSQWFCYLIMCSCDTANIAVMSGSAAGRRAEHMISVCKYQIQKYMPKRLPSHKSKGGYMLAIRVDYNYTL